MKTERHLLLAWFIVVTVVLQHAVGKVSAIVAASCGSVYCFCIGFFSIDDDES